MNIILTGGCTGGHIYPALAIGDKFREKDPECNVIYVASDRGLESKIIPGAGYELKTVDADWFRRDKPITMLKTAMVTLKGRAQAYSIMRKFKPDVVISTGSFVSVPVVLAAKKYGASIYMHEQNGFPGVSNRMFSKFATRVFLGFEKARPYFKQPEKVVYCGNPVRKEFYDRDRQADRAKLGIPADDFVITVFGGSLGSGTTNDLGEMLIRKFGGRKGYTIIFGTGREYYDDVAEKLKADGLDSFDNVRMTAYISDMPSMLSASNLVVSRAGALSVAEVTMTGRAAVFIPSANVTADHQYYNAKAVEDNGGALIVRDGENAGREAMEIIEGLEADRDRIGKMEKASAEIAPRMAADIIYETIMETYK